MKAMILAAGMGTRLKPLTNEMPKALIPVGGIPMLEHIILKIKAAGFTHLIVNIHHFGEQIIDFLTSKDNFGMNISISDERHYLLDTGGAINQVKGFLLDDEPFLVHNVDIFSDVDIKLMYYTHIRTNSLATLLVSHRTTSRNLLFDKDNRLCGWRNSETGEVKPSYPTFSPANCVEFAFGGIHVISPAMLRLMEGWTGKFSIIDFYLSVCQRYPVRFYTEKNLQLIDAGKPNGLKEAAQLMINVCPKKLFF